MKSIHESKNVYLLNQNKKQTLCVCELEQTKLIYILYKI